jgi:hypothetical protein
MSLPRQRIRDDKNWIYRPLFTSCTNRSRRGPLSNSKRRRYAQADAIGRFRAANFSLLKLHEECRERLYSERRRGACASTEARASDPARAALVIRALGVVFGDIGTSPIYAFRPTRVVEGGDVGTLHTLLEALLSRVTPNRQIPFRAQYMEATRLHRSKCRRSRQVGENMPLPVIWNPPLPSSSSTSSTWDGASSSGGSTGAPRARGIRKYSGARTG